MGRGKESVNTDFFQYKQVIVIRSDLKMGCGKAAVQASHAAVSSAEKTRKENPKWWRNWLDEGQRKIAVKVNSEEELKELEQEAKESKLSTALIADMGLTELEPGTVTALGIGPAPGNIVDRITGRLPLY